MSSPNLSLGIFHKMVIIKIKIKTMTNCLMYLILLTGQQLSSNVLLHNVRIHYVFKVFDGKFYIKGLLEIFITKKILKKGRVKVF